jgi:predicted metal-binding protein
MLLQIVVNKRAVEQISYERSSQAQSLTCPPHLIFADCGGLF